MACSAAVGALIVGLSGTVRAQTANASVVFLPSAPGATGPNTGASWVSGDGRAVLGADEFGYPGESIVIWRDGVPTRYLGMRPLLTAFNGDTYYVGLRNIKVNGDLSVIVSGTYRAGYDEGNAVIWTAATGVRLLPDIGPLKSAFNAGGVSSNGQFVAVTALSRPAEARPEYHDCLGVSQCAFEVYRWSEAGGYEAIGQLGTPPPPVNGSTALWGMQATGMSGNGAAIVGDLVDYNSLLTGAFLWRSGAGVVQLPFLSNAPKGDPSLRSASAAYISRDGSTVVGSSIDADGHYQAAYWRNNTITGLGFLPGTTPADFGPLPEYYYGGGASAANADGTIIIGGQKKDIENRPWRWTATTGMQDLNQIVVDAGLTLNGFVLGDAYGISDSGAVITGTAYNATQNQYLAYELQLAQITRSQLIVQMQLAGVTLTSIVNQTFKTEVLGTLNGQTVFTRSLTDRIDTAAGASALSEARAALGVSALRRIVIGAPTLVSNTTTVTGTATNTVNVLTGTQVTTAVVNTAGPATVITGDLGICVTPAAANQNPTGCSLSGTPVAVPTGILNSNIFTNTIQSLTPTTTQTVNQLISAVWQVAAVGGNQFGTVHALVGPVEFERGDRLIGQLIARGNGGGVSGAASLADAELGDGGTTVFGGYFGNWSSIDADARVPVASVRGNTDGFVLGFDVALGPELHAGAAIDYGRSDFDVRDSAFPETLEMTHTQVALFAGWAEDGFAIDAAAAVGFGSVHTVLGTPTTPATADRDLSSFSIGAQAGYALALDDVSSLTLVAGVRHSSVELDSFTESGGPAPLVGLARTVSRTRVYGGVELTSRFDLGDTAITPRLYAHAAQDSGDASGVADLVFASAPGGSVLQAVGPGVGKIVMELGGSLDIAVADDVHFWAAYDGSFRDGARTHAARVGLSVRW